MADLKLGEVLAKLRKQRNLTQEQLAQALGVTNQSVSKWENDSCYPDVALLPEIAAYFEVSVDELLGCRSANGVARLHREIAELFRQTPAEDSFHLAYKLGYALHTGAVTRGYRQQVPWDTERDRSADDALANWCFSACSEPEGVSFMKGNALFFTDNRYARPVQYNDLRDIHHAFTRYADFTVLQTMYALYELTVNDFSLMVTADEVAERARLPLAAVQEALAALPTENAQDADGTVRTRLEGCYMHVPALLSVMTM